LHSLLGDGVDTNVRAIFTASAGGVLVSADYSQIEMRVLAHMCGDPAMIDLFNRGSEGDIYETLARIILNKKVISCLYYSNIYYIYYYVCGYQYIECIAYIYTLFINNCCLLGISLSALQDWEDVSSVERERAKVICLGTMYGMGLPAAAAKLQISLHLAQNIVNSFYLKFKRVKQWIQFIKRSLFDCANARI
jgi:DNA polymerase I-like protein with 3'-5' exonuclease and polymerase domains